MSMARILVSSYVPLRPIRSIKRGRMSVYAVKECFRLGFEKLGNAAKHLMRNQAFGVWKTDVQENGPVVGLGSTGLPIRRCRLTGCRRSLP